MGRIYILKNRKQVGAVRTVSLGVSFMSPLHSKALWVLPWAVVGLSSCDLIQQSSSIKLSQVGPSSSYSDTDVSGGTGTGTLASYGFPELPVAPTPSGRVLTVGAGKMYASPCAAIAAAAANDTIEVDAGTYAEACTINKSGLTIRGPATTGLPTAIMDAHTVQPANCKGIFDITANDTVIENMAFTGATLNPGDAWVTSGNCSADMNGAGIRMEGNNLTVRHSSFTQSDDGILTNANAASAILIEYSYFSQNSGDSYSHNLYIGEQGTLTFRYNYSTNTRHDGHLLKSRADHNYIYNNRLTGESGMDSYEVNLPNGGESYIIGNVIEQGVNSTNSGIIDYGSESYGSHDTHLYIVNNTILNDKKSGNFVQVASGAQVVLQNNALVGGGTLINRSETLTAQAANYVGNSPMFTNQASYDLKPLPGSPLIHAAADPGLANTYSLLPVNEYVHQQSAQIRNNTSGLDIGAYSSN
jgi:hypothetical protein